MWRTIWWVSTRRPRRHLIINLITSLHRLPQNRLFWYSIHYALGRTLFWPERPRRPQRSRASSPSMNAEYVRYLWMRTLAAILAYGLDICLPSRLLYIKIKVINNSWIQNKYNFSFFCKQNKMYLWSITFIYLLHLLAPFFICTKTDQGSNWDRRHQKWESYPLHRRRLRRGFYRGQILFLEFTYY